MDSPAISMTPSSGSSKPEMRRNVVVLPQPLGPSSEIVSPAATVNVTLSTAVVAPNRLLTLRNSITVSGDGDMGSPMTERRLGR